jgi:hypothetical protein
MKAMQKFPHARTDWCTITVVQALHGRTGSMKAGIADLAEKQQKHARCLPDLALDEA